MRRTITAVLLAALGACASIALSLVGSVGVAKAQSLSPRTPAPKPDQARIPPGHSRERLHLKFREGTGVRLRGGRLRSHAGADLSGLQAVLAGHPGIRARRLFERPEAVLVAEKDRIERRSRRQQADKNLYYRLTLRPGTNAVALLDDLNALGVVEIAYPEPLPARPPVTPDFTSLQGYRGAARNGVEALYANVVPGGGANNAKIIDIEYGWNQSHEDLSKARAPGAVIPNGTPLIPPFPGFDDNHGTAVIGETSGDPNSFGVTGIARSAPLGLTNAYNEEDGYDLADSIDVAHAALSTGDVILIEQQVAGANGGCDADQVGCVAVEWTPAYYDAIVSAVSDGITVVEAAGNGNQNLDAANYGNPFPSGRANSGAIIVGAGNAPGCTSPVRGRRPFSTHGSRVNLQGWGECVVTTGYDDLQGGARDIWYTDSFGGTSSASPIVASAAAIVSSVAQQRGVSFSPTQIRSHLIFSGSPQDTTGLSGNIGPLPNLRLALQAIPPASDSTNDTFATARLLSGASARRTGDSNAAATKQPGEPSHAGDDGGASIWYRWTPTTSGTVTLDTAGSSFDTLLAVYVGGAVGSLFGVASNDDVGGGNVTSRLTFRATAGTTYRIVVDGFDAGLGAATGSANLRLSQANDAPAARAVGDFNNDGFADLAVGAPGEDSGTTADVGVVNVLRGSAGGLTSTGAAQFTQAQAGGATEAGDRFGGALLAGDFNGDGFADLAVGAPDENVGTTADAGVVNVLRGSAAGLTSTGAVERTQSQAAGAAETGDRFGSALASANFDSSSFVDLAVGTPDEDSGTTADVGVVNVLRGSAGGLTSTGAAQFTQAQAGGATEAGDRFGAAMAAANFDSSTFGDLAVGAPDENVGTTVDAGVVNVLRGAAGGLTSAGAAELTQSQAAGAAEAGDRFGAALAAANFDSSAFADLAIGTPDEDSGTTAEVGVVNVLRGATGGLTSTGAAQFTQAQAGGATEVGDRFGAALATANFDNSSFGDLAVGAPDEDLGFSVDAGAVNVLRSTAGGLTSTGAAELTQSQAAGAAEAGDRFGAALAAANFDSGSFGDLAVGTPDEDSGTIADVGVVNVLRGAAGGLTSTGAAQFTQSQAAGAVEVGDRFGAALG